LESKSKVRAFHREVAHQKSFAHDNILGAHNSFTFLYLDQLYGVIEMDIMETDAMEYLMANGSLPEDEVKEIFYQVCLAVYHIHSMKISHLDIKADNILLSKNIKGEKNHFDWNVKVCDFGSSKFWDHFNPKSRFGTKEYLPIECMTFENPIYPDKADIWGLGVTLFTLLTGLYPVIYSGQSAHFMDISVVNNSCENTNCYDLIKGMLHQNPTLRPSIAEVLNHPWLKSIKEQQEESVNGAQYSINFTNTPQYLKKSRSSSDPSPNRSKKIFSISKLFKRKSPLKSKQI